MTLSTLLLSLPLTLAPEMTIGVPPVSWVQPQADVVLVQAPNFYPEPSQSNRTQDTEDTLVGGQPEKLIYIGVFILISSIMVIIGMLNRQIALTLTAALILTGILFVVLLIIF